MNKNSDESLIAEIESTKYLVLDSDFADRIIERIKSSSRLSINDDVVENMCRAFTYQWDSETEFLKEQYRNNMRKALGEVSKMEMETFSEDEFEFLTAGSKDS